MERRYVSPPRRDGLNQGATRAKSTNSSRRAILSTAAARGKAAERAGIPRSACPDIGDMARQWVLAWMKSHGRCRGCRVCEIGTPNVEGISIERWIDDHRRRVALW